MNANTICGPVLGGVFVNKLSNTLSVDSYSSIKLILSLSVGLLVFFSCSLFLLMKIRKQRMLLKQSNLDTTKSDTDHHPPNPQTEVELSNFCQISNHIDEESADLPSYDAVVLQGECSGSSSMVEGLSSNGSSTGGSSKYLPSKKGAGEKNNVSMQIDSMLRD